jgi:hypothetical protein
VYVAEFTLRAQPGHYSEVADLHSTFAAEYFSEHEALESVIVVGDEAAASFEASASGPIAQQPTA